MPKTDNVVVLAEWKAARDWRLRREAYQREVGDAVLNMVVKCPFVPPQ